MKNDNVLLREVVSGGVRLYIKIDALKSLPLTQDLAFNLCDEELTSDWGFGSDTPFEEYRYRTLRNGDESEHKAIAKFVRNLFTSTNSTVKDELGLIDF
jgi:hypothetical protein